MSFIREITQGERIHKSNLPRQGEKILVKGHPDFDPSRPVIVEEYNELNGPDETNIVCFDEGLAHECANYGCWDGCESVGSVGDWQYHLTVQVVR